MLISKRYTFPRLISILALFFLPFAANPANPEASRRIVIDKPALMLYLIEEADTIFTTPVCVGANFGNKQRRGDMRTPEGNFSILQIQNSSSWRHDFGDGNGMVKGAYGPWFMRLRIPGWRSIGIHGTCFPESIGTRASEGCIRLDNDSLSRLRQLVSPGLAVIILPDTIAAD